MYLLSSMYEDDDETSFRMSDLTSELCQQAHDVASSLLLKILMSVKVLMGLGGCFCVFHLYRKGSSFLPHPNAKVLYLAHVYFAFHCSFFYPAQHVFQLIRTSVISDDPCFYVLNARLSCAVRLVPVLGIHCQSFNMFSFAIERAISSIFPRRYEKVSSPILGIALVILSSTTAFCLLVALCYLPISADSYSSTLTMRTSQNKGTYQYSLYIPLTLESLTITIFGLTYYLNVKMSTKNTTASGSQLGDKYQISENKKVIRILFPSFLVHFIINTVNYTCLSLYPLIFTHFDPITSAAWNEIVGQAQNYALLMPWILLWQAKRTNKVNIFNGHDATASHFKQLTQAWY